MFDSLEPIVSASFASSSLIKKVEYDPYMKLLSITFINGQIYEYIEIEKEEYYNLCNASSAGKYFSANIKNNYETLKRK